MKKMMAWIIAVTVFAGLLMMPATVMGAEKKADDGALKPVKILVAEAEPDPLFGEKGAHPDRSGSVEGDYGASFGESENIREEDVEDTDSLPIELEIGSEEPETEAEIDIEPVEPEPEELKETEGEPEELTETETEVLPEESETLREDPEETGPAKSEARQDLMSNTEAADGEGDEELSSDGATPTGCELTVYGFCRYSGNDHGKFYESVTSTAGTATVYTNAFEKYYQILSQNVEVETWSVSDPTVMRITKDTINSAYLVPLRAGSVTLTATSPAQYGSVKGTCRFTVKEGIVPRYVTPEISSSTVNKGQAKTLSFNWDPSDSTYQEMYLKVTSGSDCAAVKYTSSSTVKFTGQKAGTLTADYYDGFTNRKRGSISVQVLVPVTSIYVSPSSVTLVPGGTKQLTPELYPSDATDKSVTWSSSNTDIATVSSTGLVTAKKPGSAKITVKANSGGWIATSSITVNKVAVASVVLNSTDEAVIGVGGTVSRSAYVTPTNATYPTISWTSGDVSVATVSGGVVTGRGGGTTNITATADGVSSSFKVTVKSSVTGVSLDRSSMSLVKGSTQTLTATVSPADASNKSVTWTSSYPAIASVDDKGKVTALYPGRTVITATTVEGEKKAVCEVTVLPPPVSSVSLDREEARLTVGENLGLAATVLPADTADKTVAWRSSNESVATVDSGGTVRGISMGSAMITVTTNSGNKTAICDVIVTSVSSANTITYSKGDDGTVTVTGTEGDDTGDMVIPGTIRGDDVTAIGNGAFKGCGAFTGSLVIPAGITYIGTDAFDGMYGISRIENRSGKYVSASYFISESRKDDECFADSSGNKIYYGEMLGRGTYIRHYLARYVSIDQDFATVKEGETISLKAAVFPEKATDKRVVWSSSDKSVATVSPDGIVSGIDGGKARIKAVSADTGVWAECEITVEGDEPVSPAPDPQDENDPVSPTPAPANDPTPQPATDPTPVPTKVPESVPVKGPTPVPTKVPVSEPEKEPTPQPTKTPVREPETTPVPTVTPVPVVTPSPAPVAGIEKVELNKKKATLVKGKTLKLKATLYPENAADKTVSWKSSNKKIATVSRTGKVKGKKKGSVTITATATNGKKAKCKVKVVNPVKVKSIKLNRKKATISVGKTTKLKVTFNPKKPTDKSIKWKSSNKKIATVSKTGKVKGKKKGKVTITAVSGDGGKKAKCTVTVK